MVIWIPYESFVVICPLVEVFSVVVFDDIEKVKDPDDTEISPLSNSSTDIFIIVDVLPIFHTAPAAIGS